MKLIDPERLLKKMQRLQQEEEEADEEDEGLKVVICYCETYEEQLKIFNAVKALGFKAKF